VAARKFLSGNARIRQKVHHIVGRAWPAPQWRKAELPGARAADSFRQILSLFCSILTSGSSDGRNATNNAGSGGRNNIEAHNNMDPPA
jgi:hypothetical protein